MILNSCPICGVDLRLLDPLFLHWIRDEYECPNGHGSWFSDYGWIPSKEAT